MKQKEQGKRFGAQPRYERFGGVRSEQQAELWRQQTASASPAEQPVGQTQTPPAQPDPVQLHQSQWTNGPQQPWPSTQPAPPQWPRQAAAVSQQRAVWPRPELFAVQEQPAGPLPPQTEENPWIANLPLRTKKKKRRGVLVFAAIVLGMAGVVGIYGAVVGPAQPLPGDSYGGYHSLDIWDAGTTIPKVDGGDARLQIVRTHGEALSAKEIFKKVNPAVVTVAAVHGNDSASIGTGVIFTSDGYLLTNAHVIEGGKSCLVLLSDGRRFDALLVGYDEEQDVAVLKAMDASDLPTAEIGNSADLVEGDKVYAIGSPLGLELRNTLTDGIVSAVDRDVEVDGRIMTMIQTNAALNAGNSGGPLINEYGQVVGLNTIKMVSDFGEVSVEGLGFAIPSETVEYLANQILRHGKSLPETSMGITVSPLDPDGNRVEGLYVHGVSVGSCAAEAGIRAGDIILTADGVAVMETHELLSVRHTHAPGEELKLTVERGEETLHITLILDAA